MNSILKILSQYFRLKKIFAELKEEFDVIKEEILTLQFCITLISTMMDTIIVIQYSQNAKTFTLLLDLLGLQSFPQKKIMRSYVILTHHYCHYAQKQKLIRVANLSSHTNVSLCFFFSYKLFSITSIFFYYLLLLYFFLYENFLYYYPVGYTLLLKMRTILVMPSVEINVMMDPVDNPARLYL